MRRSRRVVLKRGLLTVAAIGVTAGDVGRRAGSNAYAQQPTGRTIAVLARRFTYEPNLVRIQPGEVVTLAFTSLDFVHGFSLPDVGVRADLLPGRVTPVTLPALKAGRYAFLCDNFCGDHHEDMGGTLIVGDPADH